MKTYDEVLEIVKQVFNNEVQNINASQKERDDNCIIVFSFDGNSYVITKNDQKWEADTQNTCITEKLKILQKMIE